MVMHEICVMCVLQSCESVLESLVSQYENHFDIRRNVNELTANEEFNIAVNGPNLAHCDSVITEAMTKYWNSKKSHWHFFKFNSLICSGVGEGDSTVLKRLLSTNSKICVMDK